MGNLQQNNGNSDDAYTIKKSFCFYIAFVFSKLYEYSRICNPVRAEVKKKMKTYKENEKKVELVKRELPKVKSLIDVLREENSSLEKGINLCVDDLETLYSLLLENKIEEAIMLLEQYPFVKKLK